MKALSKQQIIDVIEGKGAADRVPMMYHFWTTPENFGENSEKVKNILNGFPSDILDVSVRMPELSEGPADAPNYCWAYKPFQKTNQALDAQVIIEDWSELPQLLANFPSADYINLLPQINDDGRYILVKWWYCLFERLWSLRGMTNSLMDFYVYPEQIHSLFAALTDFYCGIIKRAAKELNANGIFTSDDIGMQTSPFFGLDIFNEFFKPYYEKIARTAHENNMHFWLHACGNIELFIPEFIELGLDVLHPIQKHTMDQKKIAEIYGDKICIWAGFDVQQIIPFGTEDDVRLEVRRMIDTYQRADGRLMMTAGNGLTPDTPVESLYALLDETYNYSCQTFKNFKKGI